jgi:purine-nucleoside phosphorylase
MLELREKVKESADHIRNRVDISPEIALTLGSGLGGLAERIEDRVVIPYAEIPNFPEVTVSGHAGNLILGHLAGKHVIAMQGRFHYYEGYVLRSITLPVRIFKELGASVYIVTNAAGGLNKSFAAGDIMLITDHINLTGANPLIGPNDDSLGPRFPDMSEAYDGKLLKLAKQVAAEKSIHVREGVYVGVSGPNYETPAELRFLSMIGGNAVGMSTVHEVIVARHAGLRVLGISCISDVATPDGKHPLTHEQVVAQAETTGPTIGKLIKGVIEKL